MGSCASAPKRVKQKSEEQKQEQSKTQQQTTNQNTEHNEIAAKKQAEMAQNGAPLKDSKVKPKSDQSKAQKTKFLYQKGELIDSGAYGKVYQSLDLNSGKLLAVKTVILSGENEQIVREVNALKKEIKLLKGLSHKNIVKYIHTEVAEDMSAVDIVLEYVPGGSIQNLYRKFGKFDEKVASIYTAQILEGLKYLHCHQVIHRDIKGANILIDTDGTIKLADFGTSKRISVQKDDDGLEGKDILSKSLKGSPFWMAPEVINRVGHTTSADVWSVGCVVIEMLNGYPPYSNFTKNKTEVLKMLASGTKPQYPNNSSKSCVEFLDACLQFDPLKRLTAEQLQQLAFITQPDTLNETRCQSPGHGQNIRSLNGPIQGLGSNTLLQNIQNWITYKSMNSDVDKMGSIIGTENDKLPKKGAQNTINKYTINNQKIEEEEEKSFKENPSQQMKTQVQKNPTQEQIQLQEIQDATKGIQNPGLIQNGLKSGPGSILQENLPGGGPQVPRSFKCQDQNGQVVMNTRKLKVDEQIINSQQAIKEREEFEKQQQIQQQERIKKQKEWEDALKRELDVIKQQKGFQLNKQSYHDPYDTNKD